MCEVWDTVCNDLRSDFLSKKVMSKNDYPKGMKIFFQLYLHPNYLFKKNFFLIVANFKKKLVMFI